MNNQNDFYKILQVHHDAGQDIIDAAYRCLSKIYHPDINKNPQAVERMKDINIAYGTLGDTKKRRSYHLEWMRSNGVKPVVSSVLHQEKQRTEPAPPQPKADPDETLKKEQEQALQVLDEFFCDTVNERWEKAYHKLTRIDIGNVPVDDFLEWKKAVSQIYKLGNYKIAYFRKYVNCEYAGVLFPIIIQFSVSLTEMQVTTGQISEDTTQKYVGFDGTAWRVCLGYTDLKPTIVKFKYLAQAIPKIDREEVFMKAVEKIDLLTGVYSLAGFSEQAEREMLRSQRYGNPLSLAAITVKPLRSVESISDENQVDAYISYIAEMLCGNIRKTDLIGRCNPSSFVVLFTETQLEEAENALGKLLEVCSVEEEDGFLEYQLFASCISIYKGDIGQMIATALENTTLREKSVRDDWMEQKENIAHTRLGKYRISDILGFNKKGKNHF